MPHLPDPETQPQFYAGVPTKRLVAWLVDTVLIVVLCLVILPFTAFTGIFFFPFLVLVVGFAYRVVTLANGSATWGMRFAAIELRAADGSRFDLALAFWHTLGYTVSVSIPILQVISIVLMLTGDRGQGLTDNLLGTVALGRKAAI
ncbi:MAG: RDD family protein [Pseudomonadota bacterium]